MVKFGGWSVGAWRTRCLIVGLLLNDGEFLLCLVLFFHWRFDWLFAAWIQNSAFFLRLFTSGRRRFSTFFLFPFNSQLVNIWNIDVNIKKIYFSSSCLTCSACSLSIRSFSAAAFSSASLRNQINQSETSYLKYVFSATKSCKYKKLTWLKSKHATVKFIFMEENKTKIYFQIIRSQMWWWFRFS